MSSNNQEAIVVPADRLQPGLWGLKQGDIAAAYTADQQPKIRRPFGYNGTLYANWGGCDRDARCTPLYPLVSRDTVLPERCPFSRTGEIVVWKGRRYVCGEEVEFRAAPRGLASEIDLARRMFAYGGFFAAKAGSYRNLMRKWATDDQYTEAQRRIFAMEATADLPQTQSAMRGLFDDAAARSEPPRFNPWTGRTTS